MVVPRRPQRWLRKGDNHRRPPIHPSTHHSSPIRPSTRIRPVAQGVVRWRLLLSTAAERQCEARWGDVARNWQLNRRPTELWHQGPDGRPAAQARYQIVRPVPAESPLSNNFNPSINIQGPWSRSRNESLQQPQRRLLLIVVLVEAHIQELRRSRSTISLLCLSSLPSRVL